jgi:hypothetical protein
MEEIVTDDVSQACYTSKYYNKRKYTHLLQLIITNICRTNNLKRIYVYIRFENRNKNCQILVTTVSFRTQADTTRPLPPFCSSIKPNATNYNFLGLFTTKYILHTNVSYFSWQCDRLHTQQEIRNSEHNILWIFYILTYSLNPLFKTWNLIFVYYQALYNTFPWNTFLQVTTKVTDTLMGASYLLLKYFRYMYCNCFCNPYKF